MRARNNKKFALKAGAIRRLNDVSKVLIVGAGFYGAVCARELSRAGFEVRVIEKRNHIAGNCYTEPLATGGYRHAYGPHIFHTSSKNVWDYLSQFTEWLPFTYRPKSQYQGVLYSLPFNLMTFQQVYGVTTPAEARAKLEEVRVKNEDPQNLEEWCLSEVGPDIYQRLIRGYTKKQWQKDPKDLPASLIKRLPVRFYYDDNYFCDRYQGMPQQGYTPIFERLLECIPVELNVDFLDNRTEFLRDFDRVIYTGPADSYFAYDEGPLEYRSLRFETKVEDIDDFQGIAVVNQGEESVPYTRIIEHKHFYGDRGSGKTTLTYEYPQDWSIGKEPFYPIETPENRARHKSYLSRIQEQKKIHVGGRLGLFRYFDMHQVVALALKDSNKMVESWS